MVALISMTMKRDVFQAIADPTRRAILARVAIHDMTPNALAVGFDTTRQAVSKHIRILSECRLLLKEKVGREIYYHFNAEVMQDIDLFLQQLRENWQKRFVQLDEVLNNLKTKNK